MSNIKDCVTKTERKEKVIQFGEGGFLRGFVDWILQDVNKNSDFNGNVVVVQPIDKGLCDKLSAQDCLYTQVIRGVQGVEKSVIDVISRCVKPYEDFAAYMALAELPDAKVIVSNTTEAGIAYDASCTPNDCPPASFPAKVAVLLKKRFDLGLGGFIFLPCELIEKNGTTLKEIILRHADDWGWSADFKNWVETENVFCNTLVDRINTGYPAGEDMQLGYEDDMVNTSEYFHLWVIEGPQSILKELPFDKTNLNIIVCDDMSMYRTRKVRILNGAHTSFVPFAIMEGFETVRDCIQDEKMVSFIRACVFDEIIPTLDLPREELVDYAENVIERFDNPYIRHLLSSIALNSVSKFKVRVLPSILEYIKRYNKYPEHLMFSFASLIRFYKSGNPAINDGADVMAFMKEKSIPEILANVDYWGQDLSFLADEVAKY